MYDVYLKIATMINTVVYDRPIFFFNLNLKKIKN